MATLIPSANVDAAYEDMFKEITRKLYGEETGNGLHTLGTPVAQVATSGPTAPEGERSFTNLVRLPIDRSVAPTIEYEHNGGSGAANSSGTGAGPQDSAAAAASAGSFKPEDQLSTAFGLAALMQNGFTSGGAILGAQTIQKAVNPSSSNSNVSGNPSAEARWAGAIPVTVPGGGADEIVQWPTSGKLGSYNGTHKSAKSSKSRDQPPSEIYTSPTSAPNSSATNGGNTNTPSVVQHSQQHSSTPSTSSSHSRKKNSAAAAAAAAANQQNAQLQIPKRYACTHCPYSTDRRDLYTRHENIHKDEKPFQCYACLKQFNRADHVKKHFLRMHREMVYDINKTRRNVPNSGTGQPQAHQIDQKPNIFLQQQQQVGPPGGVHGENFMTGPRQETSTSLSIAQTIESVATASHSDAMPTMKQEKNAGDDNGGASGAKIKREKRFTCCYCPWSGADKWGLKRHLNTHTKPFVCMLCDYKAARSERLATHVLKVHNKKACNKCSFLADNQDEYQAHMNDVHLLKMDAISRNTASVAQDFHKAGGVELKNQHQFFNNTQNNNKTAAAAQLTQQNYNTPNIKQQQTPYKSHNLNLRSKKRSLNSSETTTSSDDTEDDYGNMENGENFNSATDQRKAMSAFLRRNFGLQEKIPVNNISKERNDDEDDVDKIKKEISQQKDKPSVNHQDALKIIKLQEQQQEKQQQQPMKSPPAQPINLTNNNNNNNNSHNNNQLKINQKTHKTNSRKSSKNLMNNNNNNNSVYKGHRLDLIRDKENSNSIFSTMEYQNLSKFGTQFQNYVKDIINKYYAETPLLFPIVSPQHLQHHHHHLHSQPQSQSQQQQTQNQQQQQQSQLNLHQMSAKRQKLSETEEYIEYLKNKEDITLTITPKINNNNNNNSKMNNNNTSVKIQSNHNNNNYNNKVVNNSSQSRPAVIVKQQQQQQPQQHGLRTSPRSIEEEPKVQVIPVISYANGTVQSLVNGNSQHQHPVVPQKQQQHKSSPSKTPLYSPTPLDMTSNSLLCDSRRNHRKQAQPKKIKTPPEVVMAHLRDKYLKKMVDRKKSCTICTNNLRKSMLVFPYHTPASLLLHRIWKHTKRPQNCTHCGGRFNKMYSLKVHQRLAHCK